MARGLFRSVLRWHSMRTFFACVGARNARYFRMQRQDVEVKCYVTVRSPNLIPKVTANCLSSWSVTATNRWA